MKLLVIDDSATVRLQLQKRFQASGHEVFVAADGPQGLEAAAGQAPDLIILDYEMPGMNGLEVLERLRDRGFEGAVVMLTGSGSELVAVKAMKSGANDYAVKPYDIDALKRMVERVRAEHVRECEERRRREIKVRQLETLSLTDALTGLYNRRGFTSMIDRQIKLADRNCSEMLLFYFDMDNMKLINDTLGHKGGDEALVRTAELLRLTFRETDVIARMGGDEFAALAVETGADGITALVDRFEANIELFNSDPKQGFELSLSYGFAEYDPGQPRDYESLIHQADKAMYEHKRSRNPH